MIEIFQAIWMLDQRLDRIEKATAPPVPMERSRVTQRERLPSGKAQETPPLEIREGGTTVHV
jgi:hypothetical protein